MPTITKPVIPIRFIEPFKIGVSESYYNKITSLLTDFRPVGHRIISYLHAQKFISDTQLPDEINDFNASLDSFLHFYELYHNGDRVGAHAQFYSNLQSLLPSITATLAKVFINLEQPFFRFRTDKPLKKSTGSKHELFHIPFNLKHLCNNQRLNSHGRPCLYLADDLHTAWLETKSPCSRSTSGKNGQFINAGIFRNSSVFNYYDFCLRDINVDLNALATSKAIATDIRNLLNYLKLFPLIIGIHTDITGVNSPTYNKSYVVPGLLMDWFITALLRSYSVFAIRYRSVKDTVDPNTSNYVFYAFKDKPHFKYCSRLENAFLHQYHFVYHRFIRYTLKFKSINKVRLKAIEAILRKNSFKYKP
ncbi:MAG: RES family NAD+ phosphorylase [Sphingobacteriales bacterium JAD_PAG50586_3]|nr:MAG: RES family NAD+ phosphorylase [Sphingobacteriales bacterium JAD_PAG50586_3]